MNTGLFERFKSFLFFASVLGLITGLFGGLTDIFLKPALGSPILPMSFEISPSTNLIYVAFLTSICIVFFQAVAATSSVIYLKKSLNRSYPYLSFFFFMFALMIFANMSNILFNEIDLRPIIITLISHITFAILCLWQVRAFWRKTHKESEDQTLMARMGAYIFLFALALIAPDLWERLTTPIGYALILIGILAFSPILSAVISKAVIPMYGRYSIARGKIISLALIVIPLGLVLALWNLYPEDTLIPSFRSRDLNAEHRDRPNVIILLIDMARADHMGCYGYERATTPNIDRFAREGVIYLNAVSQASWTLPSTATLFSGLQPPVHGTTSWGKSLPDEVTTMAETFRDNGYATGAFISNFILKKYLNTDQGFEIFFDSCIKRRYIYYAQKNVILFKILAGIEAAKLLFQNQYDIRKTEETADIFAGIFVPGANIRGVDNLNAWALEWLEGVRDHPFFLYMHYLDVHGPYTIERPFANNFSGSETEQEINLYDGALKHIDHHIDLFIRKLEDLGIRDNSIVIITSDHGEEFMEHGMRGHGQSLFEEQLHVPLIFLNSPAFRFQEVVHDQVGLVDVLPTLIDYLDLRAPEGTMDGRSFASSFYTGKWSEAPEYQISETMFRALSIGIRYQGDKGRWKYIAPPNGRRGQLYNLEEDPQELRNLSQHEPEIRAQLESRLIDTFKGFEGRSYTGKKVVPDEETARNIRALGYID